MSKFKFRKLEFCKAMSLLNKGKLKDGARALIKIRKYWCAQPVTPLFVEILLSLCFVKFRLFSKPKQITYP